MDSKEKSARESGRILLIATKAGVLLFGDRSNAMYGRAMAAPTRIRPSFEERICYWDFALNDGL